jgi:hypothetical protein
MESKNINGLYEKLKSIYGKLHKVSEINKKMVPVGLKKNDTQEINITQFKNINEYVKKDFIYIDITNLLGIEFISTLNNDINKLFKENILLKTIVYSLTSNNKKDKKKIIYFKKKDNNDTQNKFVLYVYNINECKPYIKEIKTNINNN